MRISKEEMKARDAFVRKVLKDKKTLDVDKINQLVKDEFGVGMSLVRIKLIKQKKNPDNFRRKPKKNVSLVEVVERTINKATPKAKLDLPHLDELFREVVREELTIFFKKVLNG